MSRKELANAIRALSMDAVQKANSGHPGAPMGMADIAEVLWNDFLKHNPNDPTWYDATALFSPTATRRCCSTACCTCPATICRLRS
jgi:transketolase N-terminal domain/subunit